MKRISTVATKESKNLSEPKLTIGRDLGDRSSWYCLLEEAGAIVLEWKGGTVATRLGRNSMTNKYQNEPT